MRRLLSSKVGTLSAAHSFGLRSASAVADPTSSSTSSAALTPPPPGGRGGAGDRFMRRSKVQSVSPNASQTSSHTGRGNFYASSSDQAERHNSSSSSSAPITLQTLLSRGLTMRTTCRDIMNQAASAVSKDIAEVASRNAKAVVKGYARLCYSFIEETKVVATLERKKQDASISGSGGGRDGDVADATVTIGDLVMPSWGDAKRRIVSGEVEEEERATSSSRDKIQSSASSSSATAMPESSSNVVPNEVAAGGETSTTSSITPESPFDVWMKQFCAVNLNDLCQIVSVTSLFIKCCYTMSTGFVEEKNYNNFWQQHVVDVESQSLRSPMGCMWFLRSLLLRVIVRRIHNGTVSGLALVPSAIVFGPRSRSTQDDRAENDEIVIVLRAIAHFLASQTTASDETIGLYFSVALTLRRYSIPLLGNDCGVLTRRAIHMLRTVNFTSSRDVINTLSAVRNLLPSVFVAENKGDHPTYLEVSMLVLSRASEPLMLSFSSSSKNYGVDQRRLNLLVLQTLSESVQTGDWVFLDLPMPIRSMISQFAATEFERARQVDAFMDALLAIPLCGVTKDGPGRCAELSSQLPAIVQRLASAAASMPSSSTKSNTTANTAESESSPPSLRNETKEGISEVFVSRLLLACRTDICNPPAARGLVKHMLQQKSDLIETVQRNYLSIFSSSLQQHIQLTLDANLPRFLSDASLMFVQFLSVAKGSSLAPIVPGNVQEFLLECLALALSRKETSPPTSSPLSTSGSQGGAAPADVLSAAASSSWDFREAEIVIRTLYLHWTNNINSTSNKNTEAPYFESIDSYLVSLLPQEKKEEYKAALGLLRLQLRTALFSSLGDISIDESLRLVNKTSASSLPHYISSSPVVTIALCAVAIGVCTLADLTNHIMMFSCVKRMSLHEVIFASSSADDEALLKNRLQLESRELPPHCLKQFKLVCRALATNQLMSDIAGGGTSSPPSSYPPPAVSSFTASRHLEIWLSKSVWSTIASSVPMDTKGGDIVTVVEIIAFYIQCACLVSLESSAAATTGEEEAAAQEEARRTCIQESFRCLLQIGFGAVQGGHVRSVPSCLVIIAHSAVLVSHVNFFKSKSGKAASSTWGGVSLRVLPTGCTRTDLIISTEHIGGSFPDGLPAGTRDQLVDTLAGLLHTTYAQIRTNGTVARALKFQAAVGILKTLGIIVSVEGPDAVTDVLRQASQDRRTRVMQVVDILKLAALSCSSSASATSAMNFIPGIASFVTDRAQIVDADEMAIILTAFEVYARESDKIGLFAVHHQCRSAVNVFLQALVRRFVTQTLVVPPPPLDSTGALPHSAQHISLSLLCHGVLVASLSGLADEAAFLHLISQITLHRSTMCEEHVLMLARAAEHMSKSLRTILPFQVLKDVVLEFVVRHSNSGGNPGGSSLSEGFLVAASEGLVALCIGDQDSWNLVVNSVGHSSTALAALNEAARNGGASITVSSGDSL